MLFGFLAFVAFASAEPTASNPQPYAGVVQARQAYDPQTSNASSLEVDLGYSVYRGYANATSHVNVFRGIRFAQPPGDSLRWQAPRAPTVNRTAVIPATEYAAQCPQSPDASYSIMAVNETGASEDCLFLNVYAPNNASGPLPVYFYIHGGGYGAGNGRYNLQNIINTNDNRFVAVSIQYRLGAFGFLSSDELYRKGVVNAGILDQVMALQWAQQYIHLFGGDSDQITIAGESAGGGSVMLLDMAYGGSLGTQLFRNSIAASPYLPMQYGYKDWIPSQSYYSLAAAVGCDTMKPYGANHSVPTFECLRNVSSAALVNASALISQSGTYGTWAFLPVTDGILIQDTPSRQLGRRKVNGINALVGNNANEGPGFTPQNIHTEDDLLAWLRLTFPLFSNNDIAKILYYYPSTNASVDPSDPLFATTGNSGPTALNQSSVGTGQQQRADNIYAETTFVCPSYWLTEAYSNNALGGSAYKYQYSVPPARHADEVNSWVNWPGTLPYSYDFAVAFQRIYGNFITTSNPSISNAVANGLTTGNASGSVGANAASTWPPFSIYAPYQIDLNITCGTQRVTNDDGTFFCYGPGTFNQFREVNAYTWEGVRGTRCDFWRAMGEIVPE
ncbi:Hypothetical predicted protein [Lecanosticta acicola]|uniref:Carboxylic ester hydrolase n=1 Tax=Lecanosticta acicola TaxID=111012 RepID=A0AAI9EBH2_9PEZI|nr:Hypothetical predicted protein [Lecanosticta acicola]